MKKIIVIAVLILMVAAGFAAAQGYYSPRGWDSPEQGYGRMQDYGRGPGSRFNDSGRPFMQKRPGGFASVSEIKNISGELVLAENDFPSVKSGKETIKIALPYDAVEALELKNGSRITVKGVETPASNWNITGEKIVRVFEMEYNGKNYTVNGGPMGGRGGRPGYCW